MYICMKNDEMRQLTCRGESGMDSQKQDRRVKYTKMVLRESLLELLRDQQINQITVKDICERADINRGTFYFHYSDAYDLMEQIEGELIDTIVKTLNRHDGQYDKTYGVIMEILDCLAANKELCRILVSGGQGYTTFMQKIMQLAHDQFNLIWEKRFENKKLSGIAYLNTFMVSGSIGVIRQWIEEGMEVPRKEIAEVIERMIHYGINAYTKTDASRP